MVGDQTWTGFWRPAAATIGGREGQYVQNLPGGGQSNSVNVMAGVGNCQPACIIAGRQAFAQSSVHESTIRRSGRPRHQLEPCFEKKQYERNEYQMLWI